MIKTKTQYQYECDSCGGQGDVEEDRGIIPPEWCTLDFGDKWSKFHLCMSCSNSMQDHLSFYKDDHES